jgi:integrase
VLDALNAEQSIFGPLIRVLLLTGQRRGEVAGMSWHELRDLSTENAVWEIPGSRTKNKQNHIVPLQAETQ